MSMPVVAVHHPWAQRQEISIKTASPWAGEVITMEQEKDASAIFNSLSTKIKETSKAKP